MSQIFYFNPCCGEQSFGIPNNSNPFISWDKFSSDTIGSQYSLVINSYSGCVTYSGSSTTIIDLPLKNGSPIFSASTCENCSDTYPCHTPPIITPPIIIGYKNECGIITILPMVVDCVVSNPTSYDTNDGEVSLLISGGTPPYETTWWGYGISPALNGLGNDYYTATTVDYWHDYTAVTVCHVNTERDCSFSGTITNYTPTPIDNTHYYYTISLTMTSTPEGPYTIYYNSTPPGPADIPILYPSGVLAQNIPRATLQLGIIVKVPNTTPINLGVFYIYNEDCLNNTVTLIVPSVTTYSDFCLNIINKRNKQTFLHFSPSVLVNGYPSWVEDYYSTDSSITVTYNGSMWILNGFTTQPVVITSTDIPTANPPSVNWHETGGSDSVIYNLGSCLPVKRQLFPVSINQPTCLCDGSIIFNSNLDNPPFSYSINDGVTYSTSPIFTNLCSGIYNLSMIDSIDNVFSKSITLDKPELTTTYILSLSTTNTNPISNEVSLVNSYETTINVTPSLPNGTTITFDLIHNNSFYSSPTSGTSILTTGTVLTKNSSTITINNSVTGRTQSVNTTPGCQSDIIYQSNINDVWNSITLTNLDTITISTTSRVDKTTTGLCVVGYSNDTYSISNATINGCDCCSLIINT
jgi:hypothetical protein